MDQGLADNPDLLAKIDFIIYTTHMPLFFLIAGYNSFSSLQNKSAYEFRTGRFWSTFYPYLLWSILLWFSKWALSRVGTVNHPIEAAALLHILWTPIGAMWFLYALFAFQLISPSLKAATFPFLIIAIFITAIATFYPISIEIIHSMAIHLPFFAFGFFLSARGQELFSEKLRKRSLPTFAIVVFVIGCSLALRIGYTNPVDFLTLPLSLSGIAILITLSMHLSGRRFSSFLAAIGIASLPIYVLHLFFLPIVPRLFPKIGLDWDLIALPLGTLIGVAAPMVAFHMARYLKIDDWFALSGKKPYFPLGFKRS